MQRGMGESRHQYAKFELSEIWILDQHGSRFWDASSEYDLTIFNAILGPLVRKKIMWFLEWSRNAYKLKEMLIWCKEMNSKLISKEKQKM